jgi:hypothetical protein
MAEYLSFPGLLAGADLSDYQYHIVKIATTAGEVVRASANTDELFGVVQNDPEDGEAADVAVMGFCKVVCSTGITAGSYLTTDTTGRAVATTVNGTSTVGYAPLVGTNAGDIIEIVLTGPGFMSA